MKTFFRLLFRGYLVFYLLFLLVLLAWVGCGVWAYSRISANPEVSALLTYKVSDEQGVKREVVVALKEGEGIPEADLRRLLAQGAFEGRLELLSGQDFKLLAAEFSATLPTQELLAGIAEVAKEQVLKRVVEQVFGGEANKTVGELLEMAPPQLRDLLGEDFDQVLLAIAGGQLDKSLSDIVSEGIGEALGEMPLETREKVVDQVLGEVGEKTLEEVLEQAPEGLQELLGQQYEEVLVEVFEGELDKTLKEAILEDPGKIDELLSQGLEALLRQQLLGGR